MKNLILLILAIVTISCKNAVVDNPGAKINLNGYQISKINGSSTEYVYLPNPNTGGILAEGMVKNGVQDGIWITYFEEEEGTKIKTISNFVNGKLNGPYIEMNNRSQLEKRVTYLNDQVHGLYAEYKFGRPVKEYMYDNGVLNGISKEYNDRGRLIKETSYKNGKLHGSIVQFDDDGKVILEYLYENGEKVSGGIVTQ